MKNLFLGLFPVIVFWVFEEKFGTLWGLIAAMCWAVGECVYIYIKTKSIDRLTIMSTFLVLVLGGVSLALDQSIFFKFQPVITEIIFAGLLFWQAQKEDSWLIEMAKKTNPNAFSHSDLNVVAAQKKIFKRLTISMTIFLIVHAVVLGVVAFKGTSGQWALLKGVGFYVLFVFWFGVEFLYIKLKRPRS